MICRGLEGLLNRTLKRSRTEVETEMLSLSTRRSNGGTVERFSPGAQFLDSIWWETKRDFWYMVSFKSNLRKKWGGNACPLLEAKRTPESLQTCNLLLESDRPPPVKFIFPRD